jgi:hypothetical protein
VVDTSRAACELTSAVALRVTAVSELAVLFELAMIALDPTSLGLASPVTFNDEVSLLLLLVESSLSTRLEFAILSESLSTESVSFFISVDEFSSVAAFNPVKAAGFGSAEESSLELDEDLLLSTMAVELSSLSVDDDSVSLSLMVLLVVVFTLGPVAV